MLCIKTESKSRQFQYLPNLRHSDDAAVRLLHAWFVNTGLNDENVCCSGQLCGNGDGDGFPSLSVKGPLWSYLERLLRFHCRTPLRQQQLSCSPALAPTRGELRPRSEARQKIFSLVYFSGEVCGSTCLNLQGNPPPASSLSLKISYIEKKIFPVRLQTGKLTGSEWLIGSTGFHGCHIAVYSSCCLLPDGLERFGEAGLAASVMSNCVDLQNIFFDREPFPFQAKVRKYVRLVSQPSN